MTRPPPRSTLFPYTTLFRSTGVTTSDIVKQIRCETRDGARKIILDLLKRVAARGDSFAQALADRYTADEDLMSELDPNRLERRSEEHTSELQSRVDLVCRLL